MNGIPVGSSNAGRDTGGALQARSPRGRGSVVAWGAGGFGKLGDAETRDRHSPVVVRGLTDVLQVAAGNLHSLAVTCEGGVFAWGCNRYGQLGDTTTTDSATPVRVPGLADVVQVAAGAFFSLAVTSDGTVWAWGHNSHGQLGDGGTTDRATPAAVLGLTEVTGLDAGDLHGLALRRDGTVWAWGSNAAGQLGHPLSAIPADHHLPVAVSDLGMVTAISAGGAHSMALCADGTARGWGSGHYGQLGDATTDNSHRTRPVPVSGLTDIVQISAGRLYTLATV